MIILHKSKNKQFYFTVLASNGRVLVSGETITRRGNCLNSINSLIRTLSTRQGRRIVDKTNGKTKK